MRLGPIPTHLVLERSSVNLLSDGLSEGRYRPPEKLCTVDLIAVPGPIECREPRLNRGNTGLNRPTPCFNIHWHEDLQFYMGSNRGNFAHFRSSKPFLLPISG